MAERGWVPIPVGNTIGTRDGLGSTIIEIFTALNIGVPDNHHEAKHVLVMDNVWNYILVSLSRVGTIKVIFETADTKEYLADGIIGSTKIMAEGSRGLAQGCTFETDTTECGLDYGLLDPVYCEKCDSQVSMYMKCEFCGGVPGKWNIEKLTIAEKLLLMVAMGISISDIMVELRAHTDERVVNADISRKLFNPGELPWRSSDD